MTRWLRSFPVNPPPGRAYVQDDMERLLQDNYDYTPLGDIDEDVVIVEWDVAVAPEQVERFTENALSRPERVLVAPHYLYTVAEAPVIAHRRVNLLTGAERWLTSGELDCDYFAFGLIYLPRDLVRQFLDTPAPDRGRSPFLPTGNPYDDCRFIDQTFSVWHRHRLGRTAAIDWSVWPAHLHGR